MGIYADAAVTAAERAYPARRTRKLLQVSQTVNRETRTNATGIILPGHAILCAGAKSSASTWLYNVIAEILRRRDAAEAASYVRSEGAPNRRGENVKQFYADSPDAFPSFDSYSDMLVIQTQRPSTALCAMANRQRLQVVMTIREPRDAMASLMKRFGYSFSAAFRAVAAGNTQMVDLLRSSSPLLFRFEDRFYDREATIPMVAEFLGIELAAPLVREIFNGLTREAVSRRIETLRQSGAFGSARQPVVHDPQTRWQLGHVGDIAIGQHAELLSREQQKSVLEVTAEYCWEFGYPAGEDEI
jgi:hypothetical protein